MQSLLFFTAFGLAALVLGAGGFLLSSRWARRRAGTLRFVPKTFLTGNEVEFFHRLRRAVGSDFLVMAQVSMGALIDTQLKPEHPLYWTVREKFAGRICDYVLCHPRTLEPLLVVELDDRMHDFARDKLRDDFLAQAGLQTLRFWSRDKPSEPELRNAVLARIPGAAKRAA